MERTRVLVVRPGLSGTAAAIAETGAADDDFVLAVPSDALVADPDLALWAYSQYSATLVVTLGDDASVIAAAGPAWAVTTVSLGAVIDTPVDVEIDDGVLAAQVGEDSVACVRGLRSGFDSLVPAVIVGRGYVLTATLDQWRVKMERRFRALLHYTPRPITTVPEMVAPEILTVPFFSANAAADLIELAEATSLWGSDPDDPVPGDEVSLAVLSPKLFHRVEDHVDEIVVPALRAHWPELAWRGLHDAFVIRYRAGTSAPSAELHLHHDVAQISGSVRLNDGYEGGALEFPRQRWTNAGVSVGDLVVWPSLVTHPHRGAPVTNGTKYGLTLWFRLPD